MLQLNWKAAATVATGATALAGWLATPAAPPPEKGRAAAPRSTPVTVSLEQEASRLAARNRAAAVFVQPNRNPFRFPSVAPTRRALATEAVMSTPAVPAAPVFPFVLIGIASDVSTGDTVRTAVLSSSSLGLVLGKVGETMADSYRIERIESDSADVVDVRDGRVIHLSLTQ